MKTKRFKITRIIILSLIVCAISVKVYTKTGNEDTAPKEMLPEITARQYLGDAYTVVNDYTKGKTVVLFFSPECGICETELNEILKNRDSYPNNRWIFISFAFMEDEMDYFLENTPIDKLENSVILLEDSPKYHTLYQVVGPPAIFIYDKEGVLVKSNYGGMESSVLVDWLK